MNTLSSWRVSTGPASLPAALLAVVALASACALPGIPALPAPGAEPARVVWPGADAAAVASASAPVAGGGEAMEGGCFHHHLEEAIDLNERRLPVYSGWTDGASEAISRRLIASERRGLLAARYVDRRARRYQAAGIPIVCAEFVSMSLAPALDSAPHGIPPAPFLTGPTAKGLEARIRGAYGRGGFSEMVDVAVDELDALAGMPAYHCMVRHLLESVARTAALAPFHAEASTAAGLPSTVPLSELMIRLHLAVLHDATELDRLAAPLQSSGVPIICQDVPPIPHPPTR
jgi:hypothetical protein